MLSSARTFSKQVLNHRTQIQQQTKTQLRNQQHSGNNTNSTGVRTNKDQQSATSRHDDDRSLSAAEKMRQENRERKKRWRELNEERNKDNDLRCRVNKRANQLYGARASPAKDKWIGEEFERRQQRRKVKEGRKRTQQMRESPGTPVPGAGPESPGTPAPSAMPTGFGSYAALPPHQVRAAYGFWRSAADHQALQSSSAVLPLPISHTSADHPSRASLSLSPEMSSRSLSEAAVPLSAQSSSRNSSAGVRLPPLSSVVPEGLLHNSSPPPNASPIAPSSEQGPSLLLLLPLHHTETTANPTASAAVAAAAAAPVHVPLVCSGGEVPAGFVTANVTGPSSTTVTTPHMHLRPWEDPPPALAVPDYHLASPMGPSPQPGSDVAGLSEAAFSLMSLSSSMEGYSGDGGSQPMVT
ncbi:hypothetical protein GGF46_005553 [Coemansia sp. RSA 552]|nr:hypothetical protein GGF46_005553 [Coemansia sp. RSA 552]